VAGGGDEQKGGVGGACVRLLMPDPRGPMSWLLNLLPPAENPRRRLINGPLGPDGVVAPDPRGGVGSEPPPPRNLATAPMCGFPKWSATSMAPTPASQAPEERPAKRRLFATTKRHIEPYPLDRPPPATP